MLPNYILLAFRNLRKQGFYSIINIFGLSIAIAFSILVYFFIKTEVTYDSFHEKADLKFRVCFSFFKGSENLDGTPEPLFDIVRNEIPGIENAVRLIPAENRAVRIGNELTENTIHIVSDRFFDFFNFPLNTGNPESILKDPNSVIVSSAIKEKYFPEGNPVGKTLSIKLNGDVFSDFKVAAVLKEIPENSSIKVDFLLSELRVPDMFNKEHLKMWNYFPCVTFVQISNVDEVDEIESRLYNIAADKDFEYLSNLDNFDPGFELENITDIHFSENTMNTMLEPGSRPLYSYIMSGIALIVLIIASINYMNLSLGLSMYRGVDVGVRKVLGATRIQLIKQYCSESCIFSVIAFMFGLMFAELLLPAFCQVSGKEIKLDYFGSLTTGIITFFSVFLLGILSGSYPAFILSGSKPLNALKGLLIGRSKNSISHILMVVQFSLSIFLLTGTILMSHQMNYIINKELGFDKESVIIQKLNKDFDDNTISRYKDELSKYPSIREVSASDCFLTGDRPHSISVANFQGETLILPTFKVDYNFLNILDLELIMGRNFSPDFTSDFSDAIIVNRKFIEKFEMKEPVGKEAPFGKRPKIIGVVEDFHYLSLRKGIEPVIFTMNPGFTTSAVALKVASGSIFDAVKFADDTWSRVAPGNPFVYSFLDEDIAAQYKVENNWKKIVNYSMLCSIAISCLGLFGMTSLTIARRRKEMSIRKVLGAKVLNIIGQFYRKYLFLTVIAIFIAWPVAFKVLDKWLQTFVYKIDIGITTFIISSFLFAIISGIAVLIQSVKAACANPADSLRHE